MQIFTVILLSLSFQHSSSSLALNTIRSQYNITFHPLASRAVTVGSAVRLVPAGNEKSVVVKVPLLDEFTQVKLDDARVHGTGNETFLKGGSVDNLQLAEIRIKLWRLGIRNSRRRGSRIPSRCTGSRQKSKRRLQRTLLSIS